MQLHTYIHIQIIFKSIQIHTNPHPHIYIYIYICVCTIHTNPYIYIYIYIHLQIICKSIQINILIHTQIIRKPIQIHASLNVNFGIWSERGGRRRLRELHRFEACSMRVLLPCPSRVLLVVSSVSTEEHWNNKHALNVVLHPLSIYIYIYIHIYIHMYIDFIFVYIDYMVVLSTICIG